MKYDGKINRNVTETDLQTGLNIQVWELDPSLKLALPLIPMWQKKSLDLSETQHSHFPNKENAHLKRLDRF